MRPSGGSGALSASFEAPLVLRRTRTPPVILEAAERISKVTETASMAARKDSEAAGRGSEAAGRGSEAAGRASEATRRASEASRMASEVPGRAPGGGGNNNKNEGKQEASNVQWFPCPALLFFYCFFFSYFNGNRAAAPVGDEVL